MTDKLNENQNLEFLVTNATLTTKWRNEADAYANTSQSIYNEFMAKKKELRYKNEQEKFEQSKFTEFKINSVLKTKEEAVKLYQEVIIVHFYDFYLKFEKWMSDLIKLHNDIMSVHQKLIECDTALNTPFEFKRIDHLIDSKINTILELILNKKNEQNVLLQQQLQQHNRFLYTPNTPPQTICSSNSSKNNSIETTRTNLNNSSNSAASSAPTNISHLKDDNNNNTSHDLFNMINIKFAQSNLDSVKSK